MASAYMYSYLFDYPYEHQFHRFIILTVHVCTVIFYFSDYGEILSNSAHIQLLLFEFFSKSLL
jgi:hypothetical protein